MFGVRHIRNRVVSTLAGLAALASCGVSAEGHYEVDDAELIEARSCEVEIWYTHVRDGEQGTFISPTCRRDGNFQITGTVGYFAGAGDSEALYGIESKTLLVDPERNGYALAFVAGAEYLTADSRWETLYAFMPLSMEYLDGGAMFHANLGLEYDKGEDDQTAVTWGLGTEIDLGGPFGFIAEVFHHHRKGSDAAVQLGPRIALADDRLYLDLTWGRELSGDKDEFYTVSVRFVIANF